MWMINKENSQDLNFSLACIYCQAIDIEEFKQWIKIVIKETSVDELPSYIFDLVDFNEPLFHITNVIGFVPSNNLSKKDEYAIYGITYLRKKMSMNHLFQKKKPWLYWKRIRRL